MLKREQWEAAFGVLEGEIHQYKTVTIEGKEPTETERLEQAIKLLKAQVRKTETGAERGERASKAVARAVYGVCLAASFLQEWPEGLIEVIRLGLDVPTNATITTVGPGETLTQVQRCAIEFLVANRDASNGAVARHLQSSLGTRTTKTTIKRWLEQLHFRNRLQETRDAADANAARKKAGGASVLAAKAREEKRKKRASSA
jgi:hypothetical protein